MVSVDKNACIGCGACAQTCPEVFEMNDENKAQVKSDANKEADCINEAAEQCPVSAIKA